jgi:hypothetical protein
MCVGTSESPSDGVWPVSASGGTHFTQVAAEGKLAKETIREEVIESSRDPSVLDTSESRWDDGMTFGLKVTPGDVCVEDSVNARPEPAGSEPCE